MEFKFLLLFSCCYAISVACDAEQDKKDNATKNTKNIYVI